MTDYTTITKCRLCGGDELTDLFSLGVQAVSDFVGADKVHAGVKCPIEVVICPSCTLVQLRHTARQDLLYRRHYHYRSGVTQTMRDALQDLARAAVRAAKPEPGDIVLDIGANDGTGLRCYPPWMVKVGCEPAANLATACLGSCDHFIPDFWSAAAYFKAVSDGRKAKIVVAAGMLYDLENPAAFVADVKKVLHPDGLFIAQLMCLRQTVDQGDVGNLAHEHLEFYSLASFWRLATENGLEVFDIEENAVNGGSYRFYLRHRTGKANGALFGRRLQEFRDGLHRPEFYRDWFARLCANRDKCVSFVKAAVAAGKRVWVYGASTKGNVILQWYGLDASLVTAAADRDPLKHGKYTVGTGVPIVSEEEFRRAKPDYALVLPWAFRDEIMRREAEWHAAGGRFIFPLPSFEAV